MKLNEWLDEQFKKEIPENVIVFNFNLYEMEGKIFDVQLVGSTYYDLKDENWACEEAFTGGEDVFSFTSNDWETAEKDMIVMINDYIASANHNNLLKKAQLVSVGFVDGNLTILLENK
ncbi:MAG: hypothetical protein NC182_02560 [Prevotella sp.]|nr:hypothetical protein [Staphylococcus sp.]MCM1350067.1 hypothetical protein [Prevotella sp.]